MYAVLVAARLQRLYKHAVFGVPLVSPIAVVEVNEAGWLSPMTHRKRPLIVRPLGQTRPHCLGMPKPFQMQGFGQQNLPVRHTHAPKQTLCTQFDLATPNPAAQQAIF